MKSDSVATNARPAELPPTMAAPPAEAGRIVGVTVLDGRLVVACEHRVYRLAGTVLLPIRFAEATYRG